MVIRTSHSWQRTSSCTYGCYDEMFMKFRHTRAPKPAVTWATRTEKTQTQAASSVQNQRTPSTGADVKTMPAANNQPPIAGGSTMQVSMPAKSFSYA
jgi:hypothetical protein